jgi:xylose isomerase
MRNYLILKEKVRHFQADAEIQTLLAEIDADDGSMAGFMGAYSAEKATALRAHAFDRVALGQRGQPYEQLDQLVVELLLGIR